MAFGGSKVLEYIIRAKDATAQAVNAATSRVQGFASRAKAAVASFGKTIATNAANIQAALQMLKGVFGAFAGFVKSAIREAFSFEKTLTDFKVLLGSIDEAKRHVAELRQFASRTPLTFGDLSSASKLLLSFGASVDEIMPSLKMLGDISLGNAQKFQGLALVFAQVKSAGKLMGQDLLQMINQGFNPLTIMAEQTGIAMSDLKDMMSEGAISFEMVEAAMRSATSEGGRFNNAMEESAETGEGLVSTLKDNITQALTTFGTALMGVTKEGLAGLIAKIQELNNDGTIAAWAEEVRQKVEDVVAWISQAVEKVKEFQGSFQTIVTGVKDAWNLTGGAAITAVQTVGKFVGGTAGSIAGGIQERSFKAFAAGMDTTFRDMADNIATSGAAETLDRLINGANDGRPDGGQEGYRKRKQEQARQDAIARKAEGDAKAAEAEAAREAAKETPKSLQELFQDAQRRREEERAAKEAEAAAKKAADEELRRQQQLERERERLEQQLARERERFAEQSYRKQVQLAQDAVSESIRAEGDAQSRLAAANQQVQQAWTWYRNPESMQAHIDDVLAQREAEKQWEKDFKRLQSRFRGDTWKNVEIGKLSAEEEAVRQVALAKEEQQAAQKALDAIEQNTRDLAQKLDELLTMKE